MSKILELINGKKTYVVALAVATIALLVAFGVEIPEWVYTMLAALGIVAARSAVKKTE